MLAFFNVLVMHLFSKGVKKDLEMVRQQYPCLFLKNVGSFVFSFISNDFQPLVNEDLSTRKFYA